MSETFKFCTYTWFDGCDKHLLLEGEEPNQVAHADEFAARAQGDPLFDILNAKPIESEEDSIKLSVNGWYTHRDTYLQLLSYASSDNHYGPIQEISDKVDLPSCMVDWFNFKVKGEVLVGISPEGDAIFSLVDLGDVSDYTLVKYFDGQIRVPNINKGELTIKHDNQLIAKDKKTLAKFNLIIKDGKKYKLGTVGYHGGDRVLRSGYEMHKYNIGFEVEKEDVRVRNEVLSHEYISKKYKWCAENDSSLGEGGFELVSPIYNMLARKTILSDLDNMQELIDADATERAGGHINVSQKGATGYKVLEAIRGFVPLLYAMYPERMDHRFSKAHNFQHYLDRGEKIAFRPARDRLEIRIFPAVKDKQDLINRYELCRYMMTQPSNSQTTVINRLLNPTTNLFKIVQDMGYEPMSLAQKMLDMDYKVDNTRYTQAVHLAMKEKGLVIKSSVQLTTKQTISLKKKITDYVNNTLLSSSCGQGDVDRIIENLNTNIQQAVRG